MTQVKVQLLDIFWSLHSYPYLPFPRGPPFPENYSTTDLDLFGVRSGGPFFRVYVLSLAEDDLVSVIGSNNR